MLHKNKSQDQPQSGAGQFVSENKKLASSDKVFLILGAPGLVGAQVTRQVARELCPDKIILASLFASDFGTLLDDLKEEMRVLAEAQNRPELLGIEFIDLSGNIFVRPELASVKNADLKASSAHRKTLYGDLFGSLNDTFEHSELVRIIKEYKPDVIIDCINTATAISYQAVDKSCKEVRERLDEMKTSIEEENTPLVKKRYEDLEKAIELLLVSQSIPQIVRHTQLLHRAMKIYDTRLYLKIGTTGTGGMGLNIMYTHGEDKPSAQLMAKSSIGFAHTGLMFLMARTPDGPIVKEIKPAAMIGYKSVECRELKNVSEYIPIEQDLNLELEPDLSPEKFEKLGPIKMVGIDTGENGFFARGEFAAVTSLNQMEFVTPEEIAQAVILEIKGGNTGYDVISALDGAAMSPSYRAGYLRGLAMESLRAREKTDGAPHSVATGALGPPKLSKLLYEAYLLSLVAKILLSDDRPKLQVIIDQKPKDLSDALWNVLDINKSLRNTIISIGIPILLKDGKTLLRGPHMNVPESASKQDLKITATNIDKWADQGWVDLRPKNMSRWQEYFSRMLKSAEQIHLQGSAQITMEAYRSDEIKIGEVVGWIFNNEEEGYRTI